MSTSNLSPLLHPRSLVVVGGSDRPHSPGAILLARLLEAGFAGPIYAVNPRKVVCPGVIWVATVTDLPIIPDLAILITAARSVPGLIDELGVKGTRCALVLCADMTKSSSFWGAMLTAAQPHAMRIIGPDCLGVMAPHAGLNAGFAPAPALPGGLALVSQSRALMTAVLDGARARGIGFSSVISTGEMADVDLGDLIDLLATDPETKAILLCIESVTDAAKFMSAARVATRLKPIIVLTLGHGLAAAGTAFRDTGALVESKDVYRAGFARAGIERVDTLSDLLNAAEVLAAGCVPRGNRLAIITNGGGAAMLAVDALAGAGVSLAELTSGTLSVPGGLPSSALSHVNPIQLPADGDAEAYRGAVLAVLRDPQVDALLIMHCPDARQGGIAIASLVRDGVQAAREEGINKPVLACWLGDMHTADVRATFVRASVAVQATPEEAVRGFGHVVAAFRSCERRPENGTAAASSGNAADVAAAQRIVDRARSAGRGTLSQMETFELLNAYHIGAAPWRFVAEMEQVEDACRALRPPYCVKVVSPDIRHKAAAGGVALALYNGSAAAHAACAMDVRIRRERPEARIEGFLIQEMVGNAHAREIMVGVLTDPTFGPVLLAGSGGGAAEILSDTAVALPPLDVDGAAALIGETRMGRLLGAYGGIPAADIASVGAILEALSAMAIDLPDVLDLEINPLLVNENGAVALDACVRIAAVPSEHVRRAIVPAPVALAAVLVTRTGLSLQVRPGRVGDESCLKTFFESVSPEDLRYRFLTSIDHVGDEHIRLMTHGDRGTTSFLAFDDDGQCLIAVALLAAQPEGGSAEVALTTRADMKGKGVSWTLFDHVLRYAKAQGIKAVEALEYADHEAAISMEREQGFSTAMDPDEPAVRTLRAIL